MTWDAIPWALNGQVAHSADLARLGLYVGSGGEEGVVGATDLAVIPTNPPSAAVQIRPGAALINNRAIGSAYESYAARHLNYETVPIVGTGGAGRTDMVIARIEDPFEDGEPWADPAPGTQNFGQYVRSAVISGVSGDPYTVANAGLGYSAIALALVKLPPNTGAVQAEHIIDIRQLTRTRHAQDMVTAEFEQERLLSAPDDGEYVTWLPEIISNVRVPTWAVEANVKCTISGVMHGEAGDNDGEGWNVRGDLRVSMSGRNTPGTRFNFSTATGMDRGIVMAGGKIKIPVSSGLRGQMAEIRLEGRKIAGNNRIRATPGETMAFMEWVFRQTPETAT